ncbi:MAG TPA: hypothetical protein VK886_07265 [Vicinamibacterales bacterium]|nr:hypothetical protein [Vicinamibacterales bacterium]
MLQIAALAATLMAVQPSAPPTAVPHVRTSSAYLSRLIELARAESPTFFAMLVAIDTSDMIVYFEAVPQLDSRLRGCVHFMGAAGGYRYVRAQIRTAMTSHEVISSLAHELQHAIEIAAHPEVRSELDLAELYRRIGDEHQWRMFETVTAQQAGRTVRNEMLGLDD